MKLQRVLNSGKFKKRKRIGFGLGSGHGKTACRGMKGQGSRAGGIHGKLGHEGGQMPLFRRLPKRGFTNARYRVNYATINVGELALLFPAGTEVTLAAIQAKGLIKGTHDRLKILGDGEVGHSLTVRAHAFSAGAKQKIESAGGTAELLERNA